MKKIETRDEKTERYLAALETEINEKTSFEEGEYFENENEIREYFTLESLEFMFKSEVPADLTQEQLERWADIVIENKWHCSF